MALKPNKRPKAKSRTGAVAPPDPADDLAEALAIAVDALGFYASPETYYAVALLCDRPCGEFADDLDSTRDGISRPGKRAYEALQRISDIVLKAPSNPNQKGKRK